MIIVRQGGFEQRDVLEFVDIFFDRLSRECGLGAARFLRGGGQPLFEFLAETNGKHGGAPSLYMYSEGGYSARSAGLRARKSVVQGKSESVRVAFGGRGILNNTTLITYNLSPTS